MARAHGWVAGLALLTIGISLFQGRRQTRIAQLQAARTTQLELFKLAYEYPDLQEGWGRSVDLPYEEWRKRTYLNLIFMYLRMNYAMREMDDDGLRRTLANRFRTQPGRDHWQSSRDAFSTESTDRRDRRFARIADDEYAKALATPPLADPPSGAAQGATSSGNHRTVQKWLLACALVAITAIGLHRFCLRRLSTGLSRLANPASRE